MASIRKPAAAGALYPKGAWELRRSVSGFMVPSGSRVSAPKALVVPHAGYAFSGEVAGRAYATLAPGRRRIRRVVLLGPSHFVPFYGLAVTSSLAFSTPLGMVPVDREAVRSLLGLPQVSAVEEAHTYEHCIEVHLPFLQEVLREFALVPLVVGDATVDEVERVLEAVWGGDDTLVVVTTDLSHDLDDARAREVDRATADAVEALDPDGVRADGACASSALRALLGLARNRNLSARTLALTNSGEAAGSSSSVVGYGAFVFGSPEEGDRGAAANDAG